MMKILIIILISASLTLCEVPPPYPSRGFRPNPPFNLPVREPQQTYGVPNPVPSKFSQLSSPQTQYGPPSQNAPIGTHFSSNQINPPPSRFSQSSSPQTQYGPPSQNAPIAPNFSSNQINLPPSRFSQSSSPQTQYGPPSQNAPIAPSFSSKQTIPSSSYGTPPATSSPYRTINEPQVLYGAPNQQEERPPFSLTPNFNSKQTQSIPSTSYGVPVTTSPYRTITNQPQVQYSAPNRPSSQYDVPDTRNVETLEQIRQLNQLLQLSQSKSNQADVNLSQFQNSNRNPEAPSQQYLPIKEASNFRNDLQNQIFQPAQQYLPVKEATNFRTGVDLQSNPQDVRFQNPNFQRPLQPNFPVRGGSNFQAPLGDRINIPNQQLPLSNDGINTVLTPSNINPNLNYNTPQPSNIEIQQLNVRRLQNPRSNGNNKQVQIPSRLNQNIEFGSSTIRPTSREQIDERYLPSSTTFRPIRRPTSVPNDGSAEDGRSTESPEQAGGPNIAVATAVAGGSPAADSSFYLLQPDGRLQKVMYQKTRSESDRENEYTANYQFQNIQPSPGLVYSPLISVGKR